MNPERLQKVLASAGIASRRDCEELISAGRVAVNGRVVNTLGTRVDIDQDQVTIDGQPVGQPSPRTYVMLNKPVDVISTAEDTHDRPTVVEMVDLPTRLFPVGRLDKDSEGLLLLTDDGELTQRLTHPSYAVEKEYRALLNEPPSADALRQWRAGVEVDGQTTMPAWVEVQDRVDEGTWVSIVLREGRKRQIREVAKHLGYDVLQLKRVREGPLHLGDLPSGEWRQLTDDEVVALRKHAEENAPALDQPTERTRAPRMSDDADGPVRPRRRVAQEDDRAPRGDDRQEGGSNDRGNFRDGRREGGFNDRPDRGGYNDRPPRREGGFNDRPPQREGGYNDRPPRREGGFNDRPPQRDGGYNDRPPRREGGYSDRPPQRDGGYSDRGGFNDRPPRRDGGYNDRPPRREGGFNDRPPQRDGGYNDRPPRREGGFNDRPPRREGGFNDRPPRREGGFNDRPPQREGGYNDRPPRREGGFNDRPPRREGGFNDRPAYGDKPSPGREWRARQEQEEQARKQRSAPGRRRSAGGGDTRGRVDRPFNRPDRPFNRPDRPMSRTDRPARPDRPPRARPNNQENESEE